MIHTLVFVSYLLYRYMHEWYICMIQTIHKHYHTISCHWAILENNHEYHNFLCSLTYPTPGDTFDVLRRVNISGVKEGLHDDVIKWKYFPRYWPFVWGIHRNSPHKGKWCWALMFSLVCSWINGWVNNCEAGNLRRYRTHYDVTVMVPEQ